jgi:hypothetical protein
MLMALLKAERSARYAIGGSRVMIMLESITEAAEKTTGGTLSLILATVIA